MTLRDLNLRSSYDPDSCPQIVAEFYSPTLAQSVRYDRATFTFTAHGLAAAAAGLAGLLRNNGGVRIICEPTELPRATVQAIIAGQVQAGDALLKAIPPASLTDITAADITSKEQLELLTWLVANRRLEIRIALPRTVGQGIYHEKTGIMADAAGNRISFDGSPNETDAGWSRNYERFHLFTSWSDPARVDDDERHFEQLWRNQSGNVQVIPLPNEYTEYLKSVAPTTNPACRRTPAGRCVREKPSGYADRRSAYWARISDAIANDPESTPATIPASLWPHQESFRRAHLDGDDRALIADEVGLGKTLQAGILLKTRINQGRVRRALIITPKPARRQWQQELQRKFNEPFPILEPRGRAIQLLHPDGSRTAAPAPPWREPRLIATYQWLTRHREPFLADDPHYDLVIVDEAHHARCDRSGRRPQPNRFLQLLQALSPRTAGLLLLTATPMQTHPDDLWGLLELLEPNGWTPAQMQDFYDDTAPVDAPRLGRLAQLYRRGRRPPVLPDPAEQAIWTDNPSVRQEAVNDPARRAAAIARMRAAAPPRRLISRHTRAALEEYRQQGIFDAKLPRRRPKDIPIPMAPAERRLYDGIDELVRLCYRDINPNAMGFVMTTYRRRLGSSPHAYGQTVTGLLRRHPAPLDWADLQDADEPPDNDDFLPTHTLDARQTAVLQNARSQAAALRQNDTKYRRFRRELRTLQADGHRCILVFTEFRDTQIYLLERLAPYPELNTQAIYGNDRGEAESRPHRIRQVRDHGGLLVCTETAAESLNLQFCTAVINYDIPWNPMTLEQRIGRIDRIGQERETVAVVNLFYADTAEYDAYRAMQERIDAIHQHVGPYRAILETMLPDIIANAPADAGARAAYIHRRLDSAAAAPSDPLAHFLATPSAGAAPGPRITMSDLRQCLDDPTLLPHGWQARPDYGNHWVVTRPDGRQFTVTTTAENYEYAAGRVAWFGPGSPAFPEGPRDPHSP